MLNFLKKINIKTNKSKKGYSYISVAVSMVIIGASAAGIYKTAKTVVKKAEQVATNWQNQGITQSGNAQGVDKCQGLVISSLSTDGY